MWIKNGNMHTAVTLPRFVTEERELSNGEMETVHIPTASFTPAQWDARGYNRAIQATRPDYTTCETTWIKGEDLIYREEITASTVDHEAKMAALASSVRANRDQLLTASDWTQLKDSVLDDEAMVQWQSYRQALRDVPQQAGFPDAVEWPAVPEQE